MKRRMLTKWNHQLVTKSRVENRQMQKIRNCFHRLMVVYDRDK